MQSENGTCKLHEKYASRVNIMWGAMVLLGGIITIAVSILGAVISDTRETVRLYHAATDIGLDDCRDESIKRDQEIAERFLASQALLSKENMNIIQVLNIVSINQKIVMEHLNLTYKSPEWRRDQDGN